MPTVNVPQAQPNDEATAELINQGPNAIAAVVNGNLDDANIAQLAGSKLSAGTIPASAMTADANPETRMSETLANSIASGCVWSTLTGLNGAMTAGVAYVSGKRLTVAAVASKTFTASKDTYVYISNTGSVQYVEVANGAAQPTTGSTSALVAKVVTGASAITSVAALPDRPVTATQTAFGGDYSLSEVNTGFKWIDGKSIFKRTVNVTFVSGTTTTTSPHGISGIADIVDVRAVISGAPLSFYAATTFFRYIRVDSTNIVIEQAGGSLPTGSRPVTLWYTKV